MNASKASGLDGLHLAIVRPLEDFLVKPFTLLFDASLIKGRLLSDCLTSTVIRVHMGGDRDNYGCHWPVSLRSTVLKSPGGVFSDMIVNHLEAKMLLMVEQHEFGTNNLF